MATMKSMHAAALAAGVCVALAAGSAEAKGPKDNGIEKDWYLQTIVLVEDGSDVFVDDRSGVIGRLEGAAEGKDVHDVRAYENVSGSPGAIVFTRGDEWGEAAGQYLSDYRPSGASKQVWTFVVSSTRPDATVTLAWEGLYEIEPAPDGGYETRLNNGSKVLRRLSLVDLETGEIIPAADKKGMVGTYTFAMNGATERHFRWVQGDVDFEDLQPNGVVRADSFAAPAVTTRASEAQAVPGRQFLPPPAADGQAHPARARAAAGRHARER